MTYEFLFAGWTPPREPIEAVGIHGMLVAQIGEEWFQAFASMRQLEETGELTRVIGGKPVRFWAHEVPTTMDCPQCHGTGKRGGETCAGCGGSGKIPVHPHP